MQTLPLPENCTSFDTSIFLVLQTASPHDGKQPCDAVVHTNFRPNDSNGMDKKKKFHLQYYKESRF